MSLFSLVSAGWIHIKNVSSDKNVRIVQEKYTVGAIDSGSDLIESYIFRYRDPTGGTLLTADTVAVQSTFDGSDSSAIQVRQGDWEASVTGGTALGWEFLSNPGIAGIQSYFPSDIILEPGKALAVKAASDNTTALAITATITMEVLDA